MLQRTARQEGGPGLAELQQSAMELEMEKHLESEHLIQTRERMGISFAFPCVPGSHACWLP